MDCVVLAMSEGTGSFLVLLTAISSYTILFPDTLERKTFLQQRYSQLPDLLQSVEAAFTVTIWKIRALSYLFVKITDEQSISLMRLKVSLYNKSKYSPNYLNNTKIH